ncbi:MAG TPA: hypothetical protein VM285_03785 [Polyangia bacterium]|nr:hypothetical protein [Polyangia bacterium]
MLIPVFAMVALVSIVWLNIAIRGRREVALQLLNLIWWAGSFGAAYFTWLAWCDRGYSENWAMIGFMFFALPYLVMAGVLAGAELFAIRKWREGRTKAIRLTAVSLLGFLLFQMLAGFFAA